MLFSIVSMPMGTGQEPASAATNSQQLDFFEAKVRPLLIDHCYECHSDASGESGGELLMDSAAGIRAGGTHGPALVPGKPEESLLVRAIRYTDAELRMPPAGKLDDEAIRILSRWIAEGAADPRAGEPTKKSASPLERDPSSHWAFNPPERTIPTRLKSTRSRDPIDAHAEQKSVSVGLLPNPVADKEVLIRRLYHDLTGLPPTRDKIQDFVTSDRPGDYVRLVDTLLASPEFSERFARHWLDVARYADTVGYALAGKERGTREASVIATGRFVRLQTDMPYDEMLRHQLAGDRTDPNNEAGNLDAMGFLTLGRKFFNPA